MILLTGNSLGERQKDLNERVNKAVADNEYKTELGNYDIDKIFIIDLAAKQKNIVIILETLKSGNIVQITRALNKCPWLSEDDFANIINVDNLHSNIFPFMSIKMKKKLLCMLSINLKTESRAIVFHEYCIKERFYKIAMKFLFNTPESFKIDVILLKSTAYDMVLSNQEEALANFIRNSFNLAQTFLDSTEAGQNRNNLLDLLRYMYSISGDRYLDLLEKYETPKYRHEPTRFGSRISKEIIKKHKSRVLKNPLLYINFLKKDKIAKNSTISDVKVYTVSLLPDKVSSFWDDNFYDKYKFILDIIPAHERYRFIRKIFIEKYSDEKFEMSERFYSLNFYNTMTAEEQETWAMNHINTGEEILGSGNDYIWYKFVSFDKAFEAIKRYILITTDSDKRMKMINILVDSAKTPKDLEALLNYYYNRHVNESNRYKDKFLYCLIKKHRVLHIDEKCWIALEKLFYSLGVYSNTSDEYLYRNYRAITLIYYIINEKTMPEALNKLMVNAFLNTTVVAERCGELEPVKRDMVFQYIEKHFLTTIESTAIKSDEKKLALYIKRYLNLLHRFNKTKEDIADVVNKLIKDNWDEFKNHALFWEKDFSEQNIMQFMKTDAKLVIDNFPLIKRYNQENVRGTNWLLRKLKLYFQHDIAQRYLQLLTDCLSTDDAHYRVFNVAVYGVFILADDAFKIELMQKHVPTNPKIDHANISRDLLRIQEAICSYACMSQPPLPIAYVLQYLTGDYVHKCLPMFNYYLMNLPLPKCISFVESIIDKPVSIQKHGLRLAFQCFSTDNLKTLINKMWKRSKNISMRKILYKSLYDKVLKEEEQTQLALFDELNRLTLDLHQDDKELLLLLTRNKIPSHLKGQYLVSGWKCVEKLPERSDSFDRMTEVINSIKNNLNLVPEQETITIMNAHVYKMLDEKEILNDDVKKEKLLEAKWELTLRYLANVYYEKQLKDNLEVIKHILKMCLEMRNEVRKEKYVIREFFRQFIKDLESESFDYHEINNYSNMKIVCNAILKDLQVTLPECEIFTLTLELRMSDITRDTIISCAQEFDNNDKNAIIAEIRTYFAKFAKYFVVLLKEYINNGKWFASFHRQIDGDVTEQLARVYRRINVNYTLNLDSDDLSVLLCVCLLKYEIAEVYLLILRLLPIDYSDMFASDYINTLSTVQLFKNTEVQYFMFEKFFNSDFMFRKQMLTHG